MGVTLLFFHLIQSLTFSAFAQNSDCVSSSSQPSSQSKALSRYTDMALLFGWTSSMGKYESDVCARKKSHQTNFIFPATSTYFKCKDGSTTFDQPESTGMGGWNGFCGETGVSNILKMTCGEGWHPDGKIRSITSEQDYTPGNRPKTLEYALNELSPKSKCNGKKWSYYDTAENDREYLESIIDGLKKESKFIRKRSDGTTIKRAPVLTMVKLSGSKTLHWVTVVDVVGYDSKTTIGMNKKCFAFVNQWGKQYKIPCSHLASMAKQTGDVYAGMAGKYIRVKQVD
jgi:hypothetical protein